MSKSSAAVALIAVLGCLSAVAQDEPPARAQLALAEEAWGTYRHLLVDELAERGVASTYTDGQLVVEGPDQGTRAALAMARAIAADQDDTVRYGDLVLWVLGPRRDLAAVEEALSSYRDNGGPAVRSHIVREAGGSRIYLRGDRRSMEATRGLLNACVAYYAKRLESEGD